MPDVKVAQQIAESQAAFGILFVILFLAVSAAVVYGYRDLKRENEENEAKLLSFYDEQKKESQAREQKLMEHLERTNESHERTSEALEKINFSLTALEVNMKQRFHEVETEIRYLKRSGE